MQLKLYKQMEQHTAALCCMEWPPECHTLITGTGSWCEQLECWWLEAAAQGSAGRTCRCGTFPGAARCRPGRSQWGWTYCKRNGWKQRQWVSAEHYKEGLECQSCLDISKCMAYGQSFITSEVILVNLMTSERKNLCPVVNKCCNENYSNLT